MMKLYEIISVFTYKFSKLIPKKENRWIFGEWFGNAVSDNSKSLLEYINTLYPEIEKIWIVNDPSKFKSNKCIYIKRNSLYSLKYILTAKVAIMNQGFGDFNAFNFLGGSYKVQLWHGVAWKKIGRDTLPVHSSVYEKMFNYINKYDLYIAPSFRYEKILESAFGAREDQIVYCGQPRNGILHEPKLCQNRKKELLKKLGLGNKRIIVYLPTFRDRTTDNFSFLHNEIYDKISCLANKYNFIIIEKLHYKSYERSGVLEKKQSKYVYALPDESAENLLAAADLLITDYSSCFFDYLITDRPIIHFVYDYEYYKNRDRGLYYELEEVAAGSVVSNVEELLEEIQQNLMDPMLEGERRKKVREEFITFEDKESCGKILCEIIKNLKNRN